MSDVDATTALLMGRITVLEELVRWLSLTWGDNEPVFAGATPYGVDVGGATVPVYGTVDGQQSGHAAMLHTLWHQVTEREHLDPGVDRAMIQCHECGLWHGEVRIR